MQKVNRECKNDKNQNYDNCSSQFASGFAEHFLLFEIVTHKFPKASNFTDI